MARRNESILDILASFPWWVSVIVAGVVYCSLQFYFPFLATDSLLIKAIGQIGPKAALFVAFFFLIPTIPSFLNSLRKRRLLDEQKDISSIRALSWKQFEELVGEAFRRQGYVALENESAGADGGVDLWLKKDGNRYLVQCKQWKSQKVGVSIIREMYGLVSAHHASGAIVITSGMFTQEARLFAKDKNIDLLEGQQLVSMLNAVKANHRPENQPTVLPSPVAQDRMSCPICKADLKLRTAKKGKNAGQQFWGCTNFPQCKGTRSIENTKKDFSQSLKNTRENL